VLNSEEKLFAEIFQSSVPLRSLDEKKLPTGIASGCLIDYQHKRILLTVSHATGNQKNWAIELGYEKGKGTVSYQLGSMFFLSHATLHNNHFKEVDFSFVEVPKDLAPKRQELDYEGNIKNEVPITVFTPNFSKSPDLKEKYGFSGSVMPSIEDHGGQKYVFSEFKVYSNLSFVREESEYYVFSLPFEHPGHEHFQGCSGSPVIDSNGDVIALVCHGNEENGEIFAIAINKYEFIVSDMILD
jgi:hypothetical protein